LENPNAWSESRKRFAKGTASVLYGVIGILTADLAYEPGSVPKYAVAAGALLVGLAMALTHAFVELVQSETQRGAHVRLKEAWELSQSSLLVMIFPVAIAGLILVSELIGLQPGAVAAWLPYLSVVTVIALGFGSSYALDRQLRPAFLRAISWTLVSLLLFGAKQLGW
jgi:TRAP-type C4-dicarboxylate transport system permease large subunit